MTYNALLIGWNRPVANREGTASELFNALLGYLGENQQKGTIDSFEPVLMSPHGGDMNGFIVVRGHVDKLNTLRTDEKFLDLVTQCLINVEGFGVIQGWTNEGVQKQMERWRNYIGK